jgi:4-amino-4-deoxy-L-arabinose transferase-like glycosyltransferase
VDLTPVDERPYVGSSEDNTVMELILGHNGLNRLFGGDGGSPQVSPDGPDDDGPPGNLPSAGSNPLAGALSGQNAPPLRQGNNPPSNGGQVDQSSNQPPDGPDGGGLGSGEIGQPGIFRLFTQPLSNEIAWLLPLACLSLLVLAVSQPLRWPLGPVHKGWLLWGGWFLTTALFFSVAEFYHAYYLTMIAPPLAALVSAGMTALGRKLREGSSAAGLILAAAVVASVLYQGYVGSTYVESILWLLPALGLMMTALLILAAVLGLGKTHWAGLALSLSLAAVLVVPGMWSVLTALDDAPNINLPQAYEDRGDEAGNRRMAVDDKLLEFLLANTDDTEYMMAVRSSMEGASYVLETGRPVLYMGGFNGGDPVVSATDLQTMVAAGELRYVLWTGGGRAGSTSIEIERWLAESCQPVTGLGLATSGAATRPGPDGDGPPAGAAASLGVVLYQCE